MAKKGAKKKYKVCQRKSGPKKGKLKPGWRLVNGRCVKAKAKAKKRTVKKRKSRAKKKWPAKKYSVKRLAGVVQFRTKDGKVVRFKTKNKNSLRGLSGRATATKARRRAAIAKAAHRAKPCINSSTGKLMSGWRLAKGGNCIKAKGGKGASAKGRPAKKGRTTSAEARARNWRAKPCVNSKTGKLKPGWMVSKGTTSDTGKTYSFGRCIKAKGKTAKAKPAKTSKGRARAARSGGQHLTAKQARHRAKKCVNARTGKVMQGWRIAKGGACVKAKGGKGKPSQAKSRSKAKGNRFAPKSKYPCIAKTGAKKGKLKKGWYIRGGMCRQSQKGGLKTAGYKYPCQIKSGKNRGKVKKGFYIKGGACWTKATKNKPSKKVLVKGRPTLRGLRIRRR